MLYNGYTGNITYNAQNAFRTKTGKYHISVDLLTRKVTIYDAERPADVETAMTINADDKYATFCAPYAVTLPEGVTAYTASVRDGCATLTKVADPEEELAANTPVIVKSKNAVDVKFYGAPTTVDAICVNNDLVGLLKVNQTLAPEIDVNYYTLNIGSEGPAFYKNNGTIKPAPINRAYIKATSNLDMLRIRFDDGGEHINDGEAYTYDTQDMRYQLTYTRNFTDAQVGKWQALFVPFNIVMTADVLSKVDIAMPYMVATAGSSAGDMFEDDDQDVVVLRKLAENATARYGTPYFIRAKEAGEFKLVYNDVRTYAADDTHTLTCSTTLDNYEFCGTYSQYLPTAEVWYALAGGQLRPATESSQALKPQRWYMTKQSKTGTPNNQQAKAMTLLTLGEDNQATAIIDVNASKTVDYCKIYNVSGVCVSTSVRNLPAGVYIRGGRKIVIK